MKLRFLTLECWPFLYERGRHRQVGGDHKLLDASMKLHLALYLEGVIKAIGDRYHLQAANLK